MIILIIGTNMHFLNNLPALDSERLIPEIVARNKGRRNMDFWKVFVLGMLRLNCKQGLLLSIANDKRYRGGLNKYSISSGKSYFAAKRKNSTFHETINVGRSMFVSVRCSTCPQCLETGVRPKSPAVKDNYRLWGRVCWIHNLPDA